MAGFVSRSILSIGSAALVFVVGEIPALAQTPSRGAQSHPVRATRNPQLQANPNTQLNAFLNPLLNPFLYSQTLGSSVYPQQYLSPSTYYMPNHNQMYSNMNYGSQSQSYGSNSKDSAYGSDSSKAYSNKEGESVVTALGLPAKNGHLVWPIALDALAGEESRDLRKQVDSLVFLMGRNSYNGNPNGHYVGEFKQALDRLSELAYSNRYSMTLGTRKEANEFLSKLDNALSLLQKDHRSGQPQKQKDTDTHKSY
jgi:hypothetical protein